MAGSPAAAPLLRARCSFAPAAPCPLLSHEPYREDVRRALQHPARHGRDPGHHRPGGCFRVPEPRFGSRPVRRGQRPPGRGDRAEVRAGRWAPDAACALRTRPSGGSGTGRPRLLGTAQRSEGEGLGELGEAGKRAGGARSEPGEGTRGPKPRLILVRCVSLKLSPNKTF